MELVNLTRRLRYAYGLYVQTRNAYERAWYQGYINCMEMIIKMLKEKEEK